jgi:hypothetical protein
VPVLINNASPLTGFTLTASYRADLVTLDGVALGAALAERDFRIAYSTSVDGENGFVTIAVIGTDPLLTNDVAELLLLAFTRISGDRDEIQVELTSFDGNDPYGHAPRHTDPMSFVIVQKQGEDPGVEEGEGEGEGTEGEGEGTEGEGEGTEGEGEGTEGEGEGTEGEGEQQPDRR